MLVLVLMLFVRAPQLSPRRCQDAAVAAVAVIITVFAILMMMLSEAQDQLHLMATRVPP